MLPALILSVAEPVPIPAPQPYPLGTTATAEGAKLTVSRLFDAVRSKDENAFDKIARGMIFMAAPDFGMPLTRDKLGELLEHCSAPEIAGSHPFPKEPRAQAVKVTMRCIFPQKPDPVDTVSELMADNDHVLVLFPGGVSDLATGGEIVSDPNRHIKRIDRK